MWQKIESATCPKLLPSRSAKIHFIPSTVKMKLQMTLGYNGILAAILVGIWLVGFGYEHESIYAHGGGTPRLTNEPAGPYRLYVWSSPEPLRAGEVHMTFAVVLPPDGEQLVDESSLFNDLDKIVTGADVDVTFSSRAQPDSGKNPKANGLMTVKALPSSINPLYYEVDTEIPFSGKWEIAIDVKSDLGHGEAGFEVPVKNARLLDWRAVAGGIVLMFSTILIGRFLFGGKTRDH